MGDDSGAEPVALGELVAFYAKQLYFAAAVAIFTGFFLVPPFLYYASEIFFAVFVEKRLDTLVFLFVLAAVVMYLFQPNEDYYMEEEEERARPNQSFPYVYQPDDQSFGHVFEPDETPFPPPSPAYPPPSPAGSTYLSSSPAGSSYPPSSPVGSFYPPSSLADSIYPPSSPVGSSYPPSSLPGSSYAPSSPAGSHLASPPPPAFQMRPWRFIVEGDYARMSNDVSLSSDSGDSDIDTRATRFIREFQDRLKTRME